MIRGIRGTRSLFGAEAVVFEETVQSLKDTCRQAGFSPFIPSLLCPAEVFVDKAGSSILNQMYTFEDRRQRMICLVPEITAVIQKIYKESWEKTAPKPVNLYYLTRCYRYERPQKGRYREFWQFGVESLGGNTDKEELIKLLCLCLDNFGLTGYQVKDMVKRGLDYYVEDGFEVEAEWMGAQKQIAGGGKYDVGIGWAIGVDRLILAKETQNA